MIVHEQVNARYLSPRASSRADRPRRLRCQLHLHHNDLAGAGRLCSPSDAEMVILVKPQFELERHQVGKGGIVRDPALHHQACQRVEHGRAALGFQTEIIPSPDSGRGRQPGVPLVCQTLKRSASSPSPAFRTPPRSCRSWSPGGRERGIETRLDRRIRALSSAARDGLPREQMFPKARNW